MSRSQQQRRVLDKQSILQVFANHLASVHGGSPDQYMQNHQKLDELVKSDKNFPWQDIAQQINLDRWRLYHWYFETFQRMLAGSIDKADVQTMRDMIREALLQERQLDKSFQQHLKTQLSKQYHRSSFSIAFNNTKRQVMKELFKTESSGNDAQQIPQVQQQIRARQKIANDKNENNYFPLAKPAATTAPAEGQMPTLLISNIIKSPKRSDANPPSQTPHSEPSVIQQCSNNNTGQAQTSENTSIIDSVTSIPGVDLEPHLEPDLFMSILTEEESDFYFPADQFDIGKSTCNYIYTPGHQVQYDNDNALDESCMSMSNFEPDMKYL